MYSCIKLNLFAVDATMNLMNEHAIQMHKVNGGIIDFFRCKLQTELALADAHDDLMRAKCN